MEWRQRLSLVEEAYDAQLTPYEKSPHFWRQAARPDTQRKQFPLDICTEFESRRFDI